MAKTVGLLTFHGVYNFGAVLQAYALQQAVTALGNSCRIIDYRDPADDAYRFLHFPRDRASISYDVLMLLNLRQHLRARHRFDAFRANRLCLTKERYSSSREIEQAGLGYDVYLSGSDQVWRPRHLDLPVGDVYFQTFVSSGRRATYAPSFGVAHMPAMYEDRARERIAQFEFLSAREDSGCEVIKRLTGRVAEHVLDPTLLHGVTDYASIAETPHVDGPYILLYPMQWSELLCELAISMRKRLGLPIIALLPSFFAPWRFTFADRVIYDAGPAEFLGWMGKSEWVCSNSFHGTCFSVIYRKPFLGVPHVGSGTRLESLLKVLGLQARSINDIAALHRVDASAVPIDYAVVEPRLERARDRSLAFLRRALV